MSKITEKTCPFCKETAETQLQDNASGRFFTCPVCGRFKLQEPPFQYEKSNKDKIASYLYYAKIMFESNKGHFSVLGSKEFYDKISKESSDCTYINEALLNDFYPKSFSERIDRILLGFAKQSPFFGAIIDRPSAEIVSSLFVSRFDKDGNDLSKSVINKQIEQIVDYLKSEDYIDYITEKAILKPKGWSRIEKLQQAEAKTSKTAFIAMSFSPEMDNTREAIKDAITKAGYTPRIMNEIEHNHQIVPEMLYEIKQSKFVVADFTGHNNGAYYEAGYALGLGKDVIHICDEEKFGKDGHFDIKQINTVLWKTPVDLTDKLYKRIIATIE